MANTSFGRTYLEELAHGDIVKAVAAVEDHALLGQSLGQVLGGFSLACAGRTGRSASQVQVHGRHEGDVAAVCQGSDDQPEERQEKKAKLLAISNRRFWLEPEAAA